MSEGLTYKGFCVLLVATVFGGIAVREAHADKRKYVWTYEYLTMERGEAEVEHYLTFATPDAGAQRGQTTTELQFEYEVGMSDRFDFAVYSVFKQKPDQELKYDGYKFRWRFRFGEKDRYVLTPCCIWNIRGSRIFRSTPWNSRSSSRKIGESGTSR